MLSEVSVLGKAGIVQGYCAFESYLGLACSEGWSLPSHLVHVHWLLCLLEHDCPGSVEVPLVGGAGHVLDAWHLQAS
jgi:hypothetical protein